MPDHPSPDFQITHCPDIAVIQLPSRLSRMEAIRLKQICQTLLASSPLPQQIILDFGQTTFIDSSGIGGLVGSLRPAQTKGVNVVLWSVQAQVRMALALTKLDQMLTIQAGTEALLPSATRIIENRPPLTHPSVRSRLKRILDIIGALIGLGITAILLIPIVIALELDNPGPIFFSQIRCGWMGKRFRIWKFRSMVTNAEALKSQVANQAEGAFFKNDQDPRVTRVGRFLRRTSLDELPQFWNVLKGEMSLVGTRPPTPDELERYDVPNWQRLDVKPGMSGEWQVNGRSQIRKFEEVIQLDLRYQQNWSLGYDLMLIAKTILILFQKNKGAV